MVTLRFIFFLYFAKTFEHLKERRERLAMLALREGWCSIDDVIVYGRNELWVIKKHMVKCRVESVVVCIYFD